MAKPGDLSRFDHLTYLVGAVARTDVAVESALRSLLHELGDRGKIPMMLGDVVVRCRAALPAWTDDPVLLDATNGALSHAAGAHDERNRYVHDLLVKDGVDFSRLNLRRVTKRTVEHVESLRQPFTTADIEACLTQLRRSEWRIRMLGMLVRADDPSEFSWNLAVVRDEFEMSPRGTQISSFVDDVDADEIDLPIDDD